MEKLIELLNEYERNKGTNLEITKWECVYWNLSYFWYGNWYSEFLCISKRYEFIKRLVENDKIDLYKVNHHFCVDLYAIDYWEGDYMCPDYEIAIAVLSIQETPISFLISILK